MIINRAMKILVLLLCSIQLSISCLCGLQLMTYDLDLFCKNPSWNAVRVRVQKYSIGYQVFNEDSMERNNPAQYTIFKKLEEFFVLHRNEYFTTKYQKVTSTAVTNEYPTVTPAPAGFTLWDHLRSVGVRVRIKLPPTESPATASPKREYLEELLSQIDMDFVRRHAHAMVEVQAVVEKVWGLGNVKVGQQIFISTKPALHSCDASRHVRPGNTALLWIREDTTKLTASFCDLHPFAGGERLLNKITNRKC